MKALGQERRNEKKAAPKYSREFKHEAVRLFRAGGRTRSELAEELGVSLGSLRAWISQVAADASTAFPGKGRLRPEEQRIRELERENKRLAMERDILKKAMAYFVEDAK